MDDISKDDKMKRLTDEDGIKTLKPRKVVRSDPAKEEKEKLKVVQGMISDLKPGFKRRMSENLLKTAELDIKKLSEREVVNEVKQFVSLVKKKKEQMIEVPKTRAKNFKDNRDLTILIRMQLRNGMTTDFVVLLEKDYFVFEEGLYLIDDTFKYYNVSSEIYCLNYHQDCCLPIQLTYDLTSLKRAMKAEDIDIEAALNPVNLAEFQRSQIISKIFKGDEIERFMKLILIIQCVMGFFIFLMMIFLIIILIKA